MTRIRAPFCMDHIAIHNEGVSVEIGFQESSDGMSSGHIPWTTVRVAGLEASLTAKVTFSDYDIPERSRLDLCLVKNGETIRIICNGGVLLCDEAPGVEPQKNKFWVSFGAWE